MNAHVSIIINNYNYGRFIGDAIDSALSQTYPHVEVIVVDDGSTDNSVDIIKNYGSRIIPILKQNGGQASAFNVGFEKSKGAVILFLDSDDMLLETTVEQFMNYFTGAETVAKVHWPLLKINAEGIKTGEVLPRHQLAKGNFLEALIKQGPDHKGGPTYSPPTSGNAFSRRYLENMFPLPEPAFGNGSMDYFLSALAPLYGEVRSLPEPQGCYRIHGCNDTLKPLDDYLKQFFCWYEITCDALSEKLLDRGINIPPAEWPRNSWFHNAWSVILFIEKYVPVDESYILIDSNCIGESEILKDRKRIPFTERNGVYNGEPASDDEAIFEIEKQRLNNARYLAFAWTSFWYLEHYSKMHSHILNNFPCLSSNDVVKIFDLQPSSN